MHLTVSFASSTKPSTLMASKIYENVSIRSFLAIYRVAVTVSFLESSLT